MCQTKHINRIISFNFYSVKWTISSSLFYKWGILIVRNFARVHAKYKGLEPLLECGNSGSNICICKQVQWECMLLNTTLFLTLKVYFLMFISFYGLSPLAKREKFTMYNIYAYICVYACIYSDVNTYPLAQLKSKFLILKY